jgi:chitinase
MAGNFGMIHRQFWFASILTVVAAAAPLQRQVTTIPLNGYFCADCPSTPQPAATLAALPPAYSTVIFAFASWDDQGNVVNTWDAPSKGFALNASVVSTLKAAGRTVLLSVGGEDGPAITGNEPPSFSTNMATGLAATVQTFGFDGVDIDIENTVGDIIACNAVISSMLLQLAKLHPGVVLTLAPQMPDLYPQINIIEPGFNGALPLLNATQSLLKSVQVQMYNTWSQAETTAFAMQYSYQVSSGWWASVGSVNLSAAIPASMLVLGYPASTQGAGSGFIQPSAVVSMVRNLTSSGYPLAGLMTWDIGWDEQANWQFAHAVEAGDGTNKQTGNSHTL